MIHTVVAFLRIKRLHGCWGLFFVFIGYFDRLRHNEGSCICWNACFLGVEANCANGLGCHFLLSNFDVERRCGCVGSDFVLLPSLGFDIVSKLLQHLFLVHPLYHLIVLLLDAPLVLIER